MSKLRRIVNTAGPFVGLLLVLFLFWLDAEVRPFLFTGANFKIILIQTVMCRGVLSAPKPASQWTEHFEIMATAIGQTAGSDRG